MKKLLSITIVLFMIYLSWEIISLMGDSIGLIFLYLIGMVAAYGRAYAATGSIVNASQAGACSWVGFLIGVIGWCILRVKDEEGDNSEPFLQFVSYKK